jgi:tetratricopeptide (TPR) repeat protein
MTTSVTTQAQTWKEYYNRAYFKNALQSLKKEKSQLKIIEKNYWIGQCYDKLGYRDSSLVAYNTIEPNDDLYWSAQARIAIIYSFKGQLTSADSLLKRIEQVPARTQQSDYLQARWFYHYQRSEYDKLLEYAFRNVKHCEQNKDMSWLANAHIDLGSSYIYNSNTYKALELLKKAVAIQQKAQIQTHLDRAYQSMAIAYQSKKDFTSCLIH